ncbi:ATP-dependent DNA helicase RecG [Candidiatus Paracoxiella cheracis]|uniref:ATP-dependent DNA helicase RecG n=1 Tax=Candidiatus Paracoxiella cheracis TaxID=3405120 RepID=UPI003BF49ABD
MENYAERSLASLTINSLKGVGPRVAEHLSRLNIHKVQDLLFHLPLRYQDRTRISSIASLKAGDQVLIEGTIQLGSVVFRGRRNLICRVIDATGTIILRFFHFNATQLQRLSTPGLQIRCFGEVRQNYNGGLEMVHPEYRIVNEGEPQILEDRLTPIYPTTKGLQQATLRKLTAQALDLLQQEADNIELLPEDLLRQFQLPQLQEALIYVHRPPPKAPTDLLQNGQHPTQQRLALEELIAHQLGLQRLRNQIKQHKAPVLCGQPNNDLQTSLKKLLPFQLTAAQQRVIHEINEDIVNGTPMLRLVQGDVGSGKTIVAIMSVLRAVENGYQAAVMAPTEILAEQHLRSFDTWLAPFGIKIGWLSGSLTHRERNEALKKIRVGEYQVVIGTHALFQKDVEFSNLALVVIDEQHRFGVHQRLALKTKGILDDCYPHQLIMTATPIPRTLAMTAYVDLDVSIIDELPPGRVPINTLLISNSRRSEVIDRVRASCLQGQQAYWVCMLIEDSEALQCQAAEVTAKELQQLLPNLKVGLIHGRLKATDKEAMMSAFKKGAIDLLVATTVIEVGVDVPNANLMVIENPERLGLSQLHQLRGRIGRGTQESHCVLLYQKPLSRTAEQRLAIMRRTNDGFVIAQEDLNLRGPGEILGTRQAGLLRLQVADLLRDKTLLPRVRHAGEWIVQKHPERVAPLMRRWLHGLEQYVEV